MAYVTIANGGTCYYPRLVDKVLNQDGSPVLDEHGKVAVPQTPRMRSDLRREVTPTKIELVRKGLWRVVNEDGGNWRSWRLKNVQVAGKTGTAQATDRGHKDTVAWFACFAPFDHPKYVVAVMVQGGEHGGSVAGPGGDANSGTDFGDGRRQFRHASGVGAASASREPIFDVQRRQLCGRNLWRRRRGKRRCFQRRCTNGERQRLGPMSSRRLMRRGRFPNGLA